MYTVYCISHDYADYDAHKHKTSMSDELKEHTVRFPAKNTMITSCYWFLREHLNREPIETLVLHVLPQKNVDWVHVQPNTPDSNLHSSHLFLFMFRHSCFMMLVIVGITFNTVITIYNKRPMTGNGEHTNYLW